VINQNQESVIFFEGIILYDASHKAPLLIPVHSRVQESRELFMKIVIFLRFYSHFMTLSDISYTSEICPEITLKLVNKDGDYISKSLHYKNTRNYACDCYT